MQRFPADGHKAEDAAHHARQEEEEEEECILIDMTVKGKRDGGGVMVAAACVRACVRAPASCTSVTRELLKPKQQVRNL